MLHFFCNKDRKEGEEEFNQFIHSFNNIWSITWVKIYSVLSVRVQPEILSWNVKLNYLKISNWTCWIYTIFWTHTHGYSSCVCYGYLSQNKSSVQTLGMNEYILMYEICFYISTEDTYIFKLKCYSFWVPKQTSYPWLIQGNVVANKSKTKLQISELHLYPMWVKKKHFISSQKFVNRNVFQVILHDCGLLTSHNPIPRGSDKIFVRSQELWDLLYPNVFTRKKR